MARLIDLTNEDIDAQYNFDGYDCYDATGDHFGDIDGVIADADTMQPRYLVIDMKGWFNSDRYVVPIGEVDRIDDQNHKIYFASLTKDQLKNGAYPEYNDEWLANNEQDRFNRFEQEYTHAYAPQQRVQTSGRPMTAETMYQPAEGAQRLRLLQEHLRANKERYQAGTVRLSKRVTEHPETVNVPVTEERVVLERRPLTGEARPGEIRDADTEQTIDVPVMGEKVNVQKEVTGEEVVARKERTQRTERVQDTVRREELVTDGDEKLMTDSERTAGATRAAASPIPGREGPRPDTEAEAEREAEHTERRDYVPDTARPIDQQTREQTGMPRQT
jgi:uncharacterized protein (TIGR02271 family)